MEPAEPFGSFVVGRPVPGRGGGGLYGSHCGPGFGIASPGNEAFALEWDGEGGSGGRGSRFWTLARMMFHVFDHWDRGCFRLHCGRLPDGARQHEGAASAGGTNHHRRGGVGHGADFESRAHSEADDKRGAWGVWVVEVRHGALHRDLEDDV